MIIFAPSKINIGLRVLDKRPDGYHNLDSIFFPIPLNDILEITKSNTFKLKISGLSVGGNQKDNLVYKAFDLMRRKHHIGNVSIHLHKIIPMGAGLGGGSSDASSILIGINKLFELGLTQNELADYAAELGADCPFFIFNKAVRATGIGIKFQDIKIDLTAKYLVLIKPELHISTAEAYDGVYLEGADAALNMDILDDIDKWKSNYSNSFEKHLFAKYPLLNSLKQSLYSQGAVYASMSGSGSTIYGLFEDKPILHNEWKQYFTKIIKL